MRTSSQIQAIIAGNVQRETIINLEGAISIDQPGGSLFYTAAGYRLWSEGAGLVSRIREDFPDEHLDRLERLGFDIGGIKRQTDSVDARAFYAMLDEDKYDTENPVGYFGKLVKPFPRPLLGYTGFQNLLDKRNHPTPLTLRPDDIPASYLDASIAILGLVDYLSLRLLAPHLRTNSIKNIILKPSSGTMNTAFWYDFPALVRGCTGLICTEKNAFSLYLGKSDDLWEIAESIASDGVDFVVITCASKGQKVYDHTNHKRWEIPAYPVKVVDTIHASDAFAGGFLAGYRMSFDPLTAALYGNITASIKVEGSGPFYVLDALPELVNSRLEVIKEKVQKH